MHYSIDLRRKVIKYVKEGGRKSEAARVFNIGRDTVYRWLQLDDLSPKLAKTRQRKLEAVALRAAVKTNPEARLIDHAQAFGVTTNAIWYQFKKLGITKKNDPIHGKDVYVTD